MEEENIITLRRNVENKILNFESSKITDMKHAICVELHEDVQRILSHRRC